MREFLPRFLVFIGDYMGLEIGDFPIFSRYSPMKIVEFRGSDIEKKARFWRFSKNQNWPFFGILNLLVQNAVFGPFFGLFLGVFDLIQGFLLVEK